MTDSYRGLSIQTVRGLKNLDNNTPPGPPETAASSANAPVKFTQGFTPEQRAAQKAKLVEALRKRAAEPASSE